jgi:hypothetical protein
MLTGRSGRARVLARRERTCAVTSPNGFVGPCSAPLPTARGDAIPPGMVGQPELVPTRQQRDLNPGLTVLLFASFEIAILPG